MPKTLLLADDSVTIQKVVGISFASEDIAITTVDNGDAAVAKARELRPDVILADVVMPGLSGYEVCETIKADPSLQHIPVLLLTGTFEAFDEQRAAAAGAAGHVAKPFEAQTLVDRVRQLLAAAPAPAPPVPAPAAARPASAQAAPPVAAEDSFDFFADEADDVDAFADAPLDLDGPDGAFAFDDEDLAAATATPPSPGTAAAPPDATIAILADPEPTASAPAGEAFDFSFDDDGPGASAALTAPGSGPDDLATTTLLDPTAGSDLDVSSSDLFTADTPAPPADATTVMAMAAEPEEGPDDFSDFEFSASEAEAAPVAEPPPTAAALPADPVLESLAAAPPLASAEPPRPFGAQPVSTRPAVPPPLPSLPDSDPMDGVPDALDAEPFEAEPFGASSLGEEALSADPMDALTPESMGALPDDEPLGVDLLDVVDAEPLDAEPFAPLTAASEPVPLASSRTAEPFPEPASAASGGVSLDADVLSPAMREELRDTLEKVAWDAFGQITEKVVREAIERIERAAWEVVPKLAETLIQEEIRRLKGGAD